MSEPSAPVVFVGAATWDAIALVGQFPTPDQRVVADDLVFAGGGPAATAAVACVRLGVPAAFVGAVADDDDGTLILADLESEGVDVSGAVRTGGRGGASVVVVDRSRGTRAICNRPAPRLGFLPEGRPSDLVRDAAWVHADHTGWHLLDALLAPAATSASDGRPRVSVDAGHPIPGFDVSGVDLLVPTYESLTDWYTGVIGDPLELALADGAHTVVATRGADGSVAATADGIRAIAPGMETDVLSTLGAGDVFHGALLAAVVRGLELEAQLAYANTVAALACRGLDGRSAIPDHPQTLAALAAAPPAAGSGADAAHPRHRTGQPIQHSPQRASTQPNQPNQMEIAP